MSRLQRQAKNTVKFWRDWQGSAEQPGRGCDSSLFASTFECNHQEWVYSKYFCFACFSLLTKFILLWAFLTRFVVFRDQERSSAVCTARNLVLLTCSTVESLMCGRIVCLSPPEVYKYPFCLLYCFGRQWFQWTVYTMKSVIYPEKPGHWLWKDILLWAPQTKFHSPPVCWVRGRYPKTWLNKTKTICMASYQWR